MKKLINLLFFVGLITLFNASSCNKPDPEPELPTGENTAYYYLNGKLIIPSKSQPIIGPVSPALSYNSLNCANVLHSSELEINAGNDEYLVLSFKNGIESVGNISLAKCDDCFSCDINSFGYLRLYSSIGTIDYFTRNNSGIVNITYLSVNNRQFKGTFEMVVYGNNGNVKHITGGHFDINLDTLND